jgi:hypothetical protein
MPIIALNNATIQQNNAWVFPLTDGCRCQFRLLHDHANELTTIPIIHVSTDHETSSLSCNQYSWHAWKCNSSQLTRQEFESIMHESFLCLKVVGVSCVCCTKFMHGSSLCLIVIVVSWVYFTITPTNEPIFSSRVLILSMYVCMYIYIHTYMFI